MSTRCRSRSAAVRPAMPEPTTMTSAEVVQPGSGATSQRGRAGSTGRRRARVGTADPRRSARETSSAPPPGPTTSGRLSMSRVVPTRPATASSASPRYHSGTSSSVVGVHEHEVVDQGRAARATRTARAARRTADGPLGRRRGAGPQRPGQAQRRLPVGVGEVRVAAAHGQAVRLAHGRHRDHLDREVEVAAPSAGSAAAAGRPSGRSRRSRRRSGAAAWPTTVSTPSKWPGRACPSSTSPSGPAETRTPGSPSG